MTAPTLANVLPGDVALRSTFAIHDGFGIEPKFYKKADGAHVYSGVAVFRTGTFSDSRGIENTWESMHLNQMVSHWDHLRETLPNVPVRDGHPGWLINNMAGNGKVIGWHTGLKVETLQAPHDGQTYDYLMADYEILDPEAQQNIASGLWRNRSSEIGTYTTNNKSEFWPVYLGVAYVDIPAVEGLNFSASKPGGYTPKVYVMLSSKETNVGVNPSAAPQGTTPEVNPATSAPAVQPTATHGAPAAPASAAPAPAQGSAPAFTFSVNGQPTTDFAAVQAHITALENFQSETTKANREAYVTALAAGNKIPATQLDKFKEHVSSMSAAQFTAFQELYGGAEVPALLAQHAVAGAGGQAPAAGPTGTGSEQAILREQVAMHKAAGTPKAAIEKMESYKRLIALDPSFKL